MDPAAQERAICLACEDAGLQSSELEAVELHGTGTPLGDPVEVSALARTGGNSGLSHPCTHSSIYTYILAPASASLFGISVKS